MSVKHLIEKYQLIPHPEGGYFRETYRSSGKIPGTNRSFSTAILYLLVEGDRSRLHRLGSDEIWHFYLGGPLIIAQISANGDVRQVKLGQDVLAGQHAQHMIPAGDWFGAYPAPGSKYSLAGCTVAPGFDFGDFKLGKREELLAQFPHAREIILELT